jgi:hypothetical protein
MSGYIRKAKTGKRVIESLLHQGAVIKCFRTGVLVTLANFNDLEAEHLVELGLKTTDAEKAAVDTPEYWRWSFSAAHAQITNGTKATTAGSSKARVAKAKRMEKARISDADYRHGLKVPYRSAPLFLNEALPRHRTNPFQFVSISGKQKRKMTSQGFDKKHTKTFGGKVKARKPKGATRGG